MGVEVRSGTRDGGGLQVGNHCRNRQNVVIFEIPSVYRELLWEPESHWDIGFMRYLGLSIHNRVVYLEARHRPAKMQVHVHVEQLCVSGRFERRGPYIHVPTECPCPC